jgi:predicted nucleic acid-binding Zn ribbon protein
METSSTSSHIHTMDAPKGDHRRNRGYNWGNSRKKFPAEEKYQLSDWKDMERNHSRERNSTILFCSVLIFAVLGMALRTSDMLHHQTFTIIKSCHCIHWQASKKLIFFLCAAFLFF